MQHPIIRDYKTRMVYAGFWLFFSLIQAIIVHLATGMSFRFSCIDSFLYNWVLAFYIIPLWYPVYYSSMNRHSRSFLPSILIGLLILPLWLATSSAIAYLLNHPSGNEIYNEFILSSLGWRAIEGIILYIIAILSLHIYIYIERLNEKSNNEIRLNKLVKDAELNALKSQINPHFLFNSLNSVQALILKSPEQAGEMLVSLSDYLRYTVLSTRQEMSDIKEEIMNSQRYLSIEKLRFGDKLVYIFDIQPDCLSLKIPSMLLQPLFENAVKHGVYESIDTIYIHTTIRKDNRLVSIEIRNNFDPETSGKRIGSGTGLKNIRERLLLFYGTDAFLQVKSVEGEFGVEVGIPGS